MAQENRPPLPSLSSHNSDNAPEGYTLTDPFAERERRINFSEPNFPTPSQSVTSFPNEFGTLDDDLDEENEKLLHATASSYPCVLSFLSE